eukprot:scaffold425_cov175-Amphora_coffeaeformis.AAC.32
MHRGNNTMLRLSRPSSSAGAKLSALRGQIACFVWLLVLIYLVFLFVFISSMNDHNNISKNAAASNDAMDVVAPGAFQGSTGKSVSASSSSTSPRSYAEWRKLAVDLAKLPPAKVLLRLEQDDPFGVRAIAKVLKGVPMDQTLEDLWPKLTSVFSCPPNEQRLSFPDQRNVTKAQAFRDNTEGYFIFFQHLRKAGGTNVCTLATANLPRKNLPSYYCMPDYFWHHENEKNPKPNSGCAGCLHHWTNEEIVGNIKNHRIAGNEWDSFDPIRHLDLPAIFVSSFRRPLDRALSQFRFECLEHRGCKFTEVEPWWKQRKDLYNAYTWTFSDQGRQARLASSMEAADIAKRSEAVGVALDVIVRFHLIMSMEYLRFAAPLRPTEDAAASNTPSHEP